MNPTELRSIVRIRELQRWADTTRAAGLRIALVPTMGALHEGHLSLVRLARACADRVVVSIFVNPTQFGPNEDFDHYPSDLEGDCEQLRAAGVDVVFTPEVREMYPAGEATWVVVERLTAELCGRGRPGHFRGVSTVVMRLLLCAKPHAAVFGEKDYQQLAVIRRMVRDLHLDVEVVAGPTVREPDGLAKSSRNAYLSPEGRRQAPAMNAALVEARRLWSAGERNPERLLAGVRERIEKEPLIELEYAELRSADELEELERLDRPAVLAVAARVEGTRLIDNVVL